MSKSIDEIVEILAKLPLSIHKDALGLWISDILDDISIANHSQDVQDKIAEIRKQIMG